MTRPADLWGLDPAVTFLNHGSFGACPSAVLEAQAELRARLEAQPVHFFVRELPGLLAVARERVAPFVGSSPEDLVFVRNATAGVNAVLRSLRLEPGDELLTTDHEYAASRNSLDFVAERSGAKVVVAEVPFPLDSPDQVVAAVLSRVTNRTRLLLIDHITSFTGLILPIKEIVDALRERGVETLVDGAHGPGQLDLDLEALGAGYYTGNAHKWLCSPKGAAILHVRRDLQAGVRPTSISHGAVAAPPRRFRLEFDGTGTDDPTSYLVIPAALDFLGGLYPGGWGELRRRNRELVLEGRRLLLDVLDVPAPCPVEMVGSLASVPLPDVSSPGSGGDARAGEWSIDPVQQALWESAKIEVPVFPWPAPPRRLIRISAQAYNEPGDYSRLAAALPQALNAGC